VETDAVIPGLTAALAETGSLAAAAARLRSTSGAPGSALAGLDGGMTTLVRRLADEARARGVRIRAGVVVTGAVRGNDEWIVSTSEGSLRSDDLVLAVAAPVGAAVLGPSSEVSLALSRLAIGDVVVCAAVLDAPELDDDPVGSGLLVAPGNERIRAKALTHATAKWQWIRDAYGPGTHLVRLSYGRNGRVEELPDELPGIVRSDLAAILAIDRPVIRDLLVTRWSQSLVLPTVGHRAAVAAVRAEVEAAPGLAVVGAGLGGNGLAGTIAVARGVREQLDRR
jgi:protoporphyrinogen/coproporphyrinogen III oxidase